MKIETRPTIVALALAMGAIGHTCCSVSPELEWVEFGRQTNLIIWDEATKTEHFVRKADFNTKAKDFGFIAPTPSIPELAEADEQAFYALAALAPRPRNDSKSAGGVDAMALEGEAPVVVQEVDVAGYRATTLKANDAAGLAKWMKDNGYATSPTIEEWTKHYIAKGWYLTTFKVLGGNSPTTGCVRMSFKADQPFNPYYVPKDNAPKSPGSAGLQLYFVSQKRFSPDQGLGNPKWTVELPSSTKTVLAGHLKLKSLPDGMKVSCFFDRKFPNIEAKEDVFFHPSPLDASKGSTSTMIVGALGAAAVGMGMIWWIRRRPAA